jgi:plastocyanin
MQTGGFRPLLAAVALSATAAPAHAATIQIVMENLEISPAAASAKVGDTIEWVNKDALAHTATARSGIFDVTLPPKQTGRLVVHQAGNIDYYCRFHPNMKATLTIAP